MAGTGLLLLLDDIASILDDVALMTKMATKKTAGILGDDLALNAQQVSGVVSDRELPVVWAVAKGSLLNKVILIPAALAISTFAAWLIIPLLMIGGAYLCFEGAEKLLHRFLDHGSDEAAVKNPVELPADFDPILEEKKKIKGAIRTDFVLSAEFIVISLGAVPTGAAFGLQAAVLCAVGLLMTVGVYGLVAAIVKLDDAGLLLLRKNPKDGLWRKLGAFLVGASPLLMRLLTVVGTAAMFMVGGGILVHGLPFFHPLMDDLSRLPFAGLLTLLCNAVAGVVAGAILCLPVHWGKKLFTRKKA